MNDDCLDSDLFLSRYLVPDEPAPKATSAGGEFLGVLASGIGSVLGVALDVGVVVSKVALEDDGFSVGDATHHDPSEGYISAIYGGPGRYSYYPYAYFESSDS